MTPANFKIRDKSIAIDSGMLDRALGCEDKIRKTSKLSLTQHSKYWGLILVCFVQQSDTNTMANSACCSMRMYSNFGAGPA